jgi:Ca-activated chloride channel homolog
MLGDAQARDPLNRGQFKQAGLLATTAFLLGLLLPALGLAQVSPPTMLVKIKDKSQPIKLSAVKIETTIVGFVAETRMTMTFFNPHSRQMAGDLYFPLPEGSTVSGYALDVHGKMVDGVVVEKDKGRQVFEAEVRKGIDPGLVEWTKGNNFKTRVFPIPPEGTRTIMVRYVTELTMTNDGPLFHLPLNFRDKVDQFSLRVEVVKYASQPLVKDNPLANFEFARWRDSFVAETVLKNQALTKDLKIALPDVSKAPVMVQKGLDGDHYFGISDLPELPDSEGKAAMDAGHVTILWDASGSRGMVDHEKEKALLAAFFRGFRSAAEVDLVLYRNVRGESHRISIKDGDVSALLAALDAVRYDGGTSMAAISPPRVEKTPDFYLLFTDGISNFGKEEPGQFDAPLFIFSGASATNHPFLRYLALKNGGRYINLNRVEPKMAVGLMGRTPFSFLKARVISGKVAATYPQVATAVAGRFMLAGKLLSDEATIELQYGLQGKVSYKTSYTIKKKDGVQGDVLRTFFGQKKIDDLAMLPDKNADELVLTGREFGMVTPGTSLIVLETLGQYVEHKIPPPRTLPEMRADYFKEQERRDLAEKERKSNKIDSVLAMWKERVEWWNKKFDIPKDFRVKEEKESQMGSGGGGSSASGRGVARMLRSNPSAARDEAALDDDNDSEDSPADRRPEPARPRAKKSKKKGDSSGEDIPEPEPSIVLKEWNPDTPYLKALEKAGKREALDVYMEQRKELGTSPAFFLDCADYFFRHDMAAMGLQVLSNIAELELESHSLLRILGYRLAQKGYLDLARMVFEQVLKLRPEEPQSYRDLALVLGDLKQFPRAAELLYHVVMHDWDRFDRIEVIALMELNRLLAHAKRAGIRKTGVDIDKRLLTLLDVDVRIILTWDTDLTDMDLWVFEPSGEKAYYGNNRSQIGGLVSRDFTQGYGPEEYIIKKAMKGKYTIKVNYYGSSAPKLVGAVTLQVDVFTNYGRKKEKRQNLTVRLTQSKDEVLVGEITF